HDLPPARPHEARGRPRALGRRPRRDHAAPSRPHPGGALVIVPTYTSGSWSAVVTDGAVALLSPATDPATVTAVWESLRAGEGVARQVELLIAGGLRDAPPFALLSVRGGDGHLIVRGDVEA